MGNIIVKFSLNLFSKTLYVSNVVLWMVLNRTSTGQFYVVWLSVMVMMIPLSANAAPTTSGTHWVVVIRNTISMQKDQRVALVNTLPKLLYQKPAIEPENRLKLPIFNPNHDHLSLVFASIHDTYKYKQKSNTSWYPKNCRKYLRESDRTAKLDRFFIIPKDSDKSVSSEEDLIKSVSSEEDLIKLVSSEEAFTNLLRKWVEDPGPCLFKGFHFNEYIAENAVVPYLRAIRLQPAVTKTTIIVLVNNTDGSISMGESNQIKEFEESYKAARNFRTDYLIVNPADWIFTVSSDGEGLKSGLDLDSDKKKILIRYMISKATYLSDGFKSTMVNLEEDNPPINQGIGLEEYLYIAISMLIAAVCIGPLLMYYYMRSKNRICIPE